MGTIKLAGISFQVLRVDGDRDGKGLPDRILLERDGVCGDYMRTTGLRLTFTIDHPGETAAGISSFTDTVTVEVESGDPGGEEGEFAEFMLQALREWYDGARVTTT